MNLEILRQKIQAIEWSEVNHKSVVPFGTSVIDDALPQKGINTGCVHEWTGSNLGTLFAVCGSILGRLTKSHGPILWCSQHLRVYPAGLYPYGLSSTDVIFAKPNNQKEVLWATEEGLKTPQLGAVVAETSQISLSEARRLQLCSQKSGVTLFLLTNHENTLALGTSYSRWLVEPLASDKAPGLWQDNAIGSLRFFITLQRYRGAITPQSWELEWNAKTLSFNILSSRKSKVKKNL